MLRWCLKQGVLKENYHHRCIPDGISVTMVFTVYSSVNMKKNYHLCLSAGDETLFRDTADYHRGFNCFASALHKTDATGLAETFMSTHTHMLVQTDDPDEFMYTFRRAYSIYFNHKYQREGRLGEKRHFSMEVAGYHHLLAALSYILRNALHHGVVSIPYAYPHCSVNAIFRKEMGKFQNEELLPPSAYYKHVSRRAEYPDSYKMTANGVFARDTVLDIPQVENLFVTPRAFNFYMSRKSSEEWEKEQAKDENARPPVNLTTIEEGVNLHNRDTMLIFENGKADYRKISDIDLCTMLDEWARTRYAKHSVYQLTRKEQIQIAQELYRTYRLNEVQIRRCLAFHK